MSELIIDKLTTRDGSNVGAIVVADIDELLLLNTNKEINTTAIVKDSNRGGVFNYDGAQSGVNNGGTIFNGWVRQYDGAVNVKWFGAVGDATIGAVSGDTRAFTGTYDDDAIHKAIDYLKGLGGGTLLFDSLCLVAKNVVPWHNQTWIGTDNRNSGIFFGENPHYNDSIWLGTPWNTTDDYYGELTVLENFKISNMRISSYRKDNPYTQEPGNRHQCWGIGGLFNGLTVEGCYGDFLTYDLVDVSDNYDNGVTVCKDIYIRNNTVENTGRHGITNRGGLNFNVEGNVISNCLSRGITIEAGIGTLLGDARIINNTVTDCDYGFAFENYPNTTQDTSFTFSGNVISNCNVGGLFDTTDSTPTNAHILTVSNNKIYGDTRFTYSQMAFVTNNIFAGNVVCEIVSDIIFMGNIISGTFSNNYSDNVLLADNKFTRTALTEAHALITVGNTNTNLRILRNTFDTSSGTYLSGYINTYGLTNTAEIRNNTYLGSGETYPVFLLGNITSKYNKGFPAQGIWGNAGYAEYREQNTQFSVAPTGTSTFTPESLADGVYSLIYFMNIDSSINKFEEYRLVNYGSSVTITQVATSFTSDLDIVVTESGGDITLTNNYDYAFHLAWSLIKL